MIPRRRKAPRRGPLRDDGYRRFLRQHGRCVACGIVDPRGNYHTMGKCDPAHTQNNGMRQKGPDDSCAPLCRIHHDEYDGHRKLPNGDVGRKAFERFYCVDMAEEAKAWWALYRLELRNVRSADKGEAMLTRSDADDFATTPRYCTCGGPATVSLFGRTVCSQCGKEKREERQEKR